MSGKKIQCREQDVKALLTTVVLPQPVSPTNKTGACIWTQLPNDSNKRSDCPVQAKFDDDDDDDDEEEEEEEEEPTTGFSFCTGNVTRPTTTI